MRKNLLLAIVCLLCHHGYAQIKYEPGYWVDNLSKKVECLIKNSDWKDNPTKFTYKLSEEAEPQEATLTSVTKFGVTNHSEYQRFTVDMDRSSENPRKLSRDKQPILQEEQVFLKVLVGGQATLLYYEDGNLRRFFYQLENANPVQLVYKKYTNAKRELRENNHYRQQLWNNLSCAGISIKDVEKIDYDLKPLTQFFIQYNDCHQSPYTSYLPTQQKDLFDLALRPGYNVSSLSIDNINNDFRDTDFEKKYGFRIGLEAEFILPFNKNKWALLLEPTYQRYQSEKEVLRNQLVLERATVDYQMIDIAVGGRYYVFLNDRNKLFGNLLYNFSSDFNSKIAFARTSDLDIRSALNLMFGIGGELANRYSVEIRSGLSREILNIDRVDWQSSYNCSSVILGYRLF